MGALLQDRAGNYVARHPITLDGSGLVYIELRPDLDFETIRGNAGVPTLVNQGIFRGFSLPEFAANDEELYGTICVPSRWLAGGNIYFHLYCWLAIAEDAKNFNFQVSWEHYTPVTDTVPATSTDVPVETATGALAAQFQSYIAEFTLVPVDLAAEDIMTVRLRRIAASANDCVGEIVVNHYGVMFRRNKLGIVTP